MNETLSNITPVNHRKLVSEVYEHLKNHQKLSRPEVQKMARAYGIEDKTWIKELTELAITLRARELASGNGSSLEKFDRIVSLYQIQTNISFRTSMSMLLQQYSTPAPIGYLMGLFCEVDRKGKTLFEPSAGNGLLSIAAHPSEVVVNEIDLIRNANLSQQGYKQVLQIDASVSFDGFDRKFDAAITNPPFGRLAAPILVKGYRISELDHLMAIHALDTMKDGGKAAIIIGGHTKFDSKGRIQKGRQRIFFNYLYHHYHVLDVIPINGRNLYSRQGTSFNTRLILIDGRKTPPEGVAPNQSQHLIQPIGDFQTLYQRVMSHLTPHNKNLKKQALKLKAQLLAGELGAPYKPASNACFILDTQVPDAMEFEMHKATARIREDVGGDIDNFVRHRLGYDTKAELCKALSAEQADAVALAIYNIEAFSQAVIIGDQTGIGKGRVAASIIRYAVHQGITPIFLTEKANLFSDIYRDLKAIGSAHLNPLIINSRDSKTNIKDENGEIIYQAPTAPEQAQIFKAKKIPSEYDFVVGTYTQFNSPKTKPIKPEFLSSIAKGAIIIMDESHNSSGSSNTGIFMQSVLAKTAGAVFLSATFAKRPDNMPIYAMKTAISEANMSKEDLVEAISNGGVALQEVLASQLVAEGQMIRRERSYEGIEVNYITLSELANEHRAIADNITTIVRDIIAFQNLHVNERVSELDSIAVAEGKEVETREGTSQSGVDNQPYFSKVFNVINQMLFSIKAEAVADRAIGRLKEGKKPVIAFSSTMGSFIEDMTDANGYAVGVGDVVKADFAIVLQKGLEGVMRYTETLPNGQKDYKTFSVFELSEEAQNEYFRIERTIQQIATGITISPIDVIVQKIEDAGYSVAEVTGRKLRLNLQLDSGMGEIQPRKKINTNDAFREFNDNQVDVLLINQSGSTGASAHAIVTDKVPASEVKQRVMIVLQPELNINTEVQKRGRINRTGQILLPQYDYVNSAIPAEQRLMMMLQKKLKSLDANTSSNQKQSNSILDVPDFLNKYGDKIVMEYLQENHQVNVLLGNPLKLGSGAELKEGAAHKVSGRVAILSVQMQEEFYRDIKDRYDNYVAYLKQTGDYDLEVEQLDLQAKTISSSVIKVGKGGRSSFGEDTILEKVEANVLRKPFSTGELDNLIKQSLGGKTQQDIKNDLIDHYERFIAEYLQVSINEISDRYRRLISNIPNEKKILNLIDAADGSVQKAIEERTKELQTAMEKRIADEQTSTQHKKQFILGLFKFFTIGRPLFYPVPTFDGSALNQSAVFLGFQIDHERKNPYAPSSIKLRFAIASSQKYIAIPASFHKDVNAIKGASMDIRTLSQSQVLDKWEQAISASSKDRAIRYVLTGNILQAFADFKGKLVSYTTEQGTIKKGILMSEHWSPDEQVGGKVVVPILKALKIMQSLTAGAGITASGGITLFKMHTGNYRVSVSASKKQGGEVFLNLGLMKLVENEKFEKIGSQMTAYLPPKNLEKFLGILQNEMGVSISVTQSQLDAVGLTKDRKRRSVRIELPPPELSQNDYRRKMKLKATALKLKLDLLSF